MLTLDALFDATPRKAGRRIILRPVRHTLAFERALELLSAAVIAEIRRIARQDIYEAAVRQRGQIGDAVADVDIYGGGARRPNSLLGQALGRMRDAAERVIDAVMARFVRLFGDEGGRFDRRFTAAFSSAVADGIDLSRVLRLSNLEGRAQLAAERHAALIRGLTADIERRIAAKVGDLMASGATNAAIAEALADSFGFGLKRARFIARDQAAKWNGELNRLRQVEAGVTEYIWSTSLDERVRGNPDGRYPNARPSHWAREGQVFRWSDAPSDGHPGIPINCRCVAKAVIIF